MIHSTRGGGMPAQQLISGWDGMFLDGRFQPGIFKTRHSGFR
jgi:hypothetical protein